MGEEGKALGAGLVIGMLFGVMVALLIVVAAGASISSPPPTIYHGRVSGIFVGAGEQTAIINFDHTAAVTCNFYGQNSTQVSRLLDVHAGQTITLVYAQHHCYLAP